MKNVLLALALAGPGLVLAPVAGAEMTCAAYGAICTGDSPDDPFAACDGTWVDTWLYGFHYNQVCIGDDMTVHVYVCPMSGSWNADCRLV